jgi:hypothetical protein
MTALSGTINTTATVTVMRNEQRVTLSVYRGSTADIHRICQLQQERRDDIEKARRAQLETRRAQLEAYHKQKCAIHDSHRTPWEESCQKGDLENLKDKMRDVLRNTSSNVSPIDIKHMRDRIEEMTVKLHEDDKREKRELEALPYYCLHCVRVSSTTLPECECEEFCTKCKLLGHTAKNCPEMKRAHLPPSNPFNGRWASVDIMYEENGSITDVGSYGRYGLCVGDIIIHCWQNINADTSTLHDCEHFHEITDGHMGSPVVLVIRRGDKDMRVSFWRGSTKDIRASGQAKAAVVPTLAANGGCR